MTPPPDPQQPERGSEPAEIQLSVAETLVLLREGTLTVDEMLPWSSNYSFIGRVEREGVVAPVVYKPRDGERPLWDFPSGTLFRREIAAFVVSDALGWHLVPPTVAREGEHGIGMVQLFVPHDPEEHFFTFRDPWPPALTRMALFDLVINNADRKGGHCLRDRHGRYWAIDHGVSFHVEPKLRTVIWEVAGEPFPPPLLADLVRLRDALAASSGPCAALSPLLAPAELDALIARLDELVRTAHFPMPAPGRRHTPWPLV